MSFSQIESLLHNQNYLEAMKLIHKELSKSFDFSNSDQKTEFDLLHEHLNEAQLSLLNNFYKTESNRATRSFALANDKSKKITFNHKLFFENESRLRIEKSGYNYIDREGENIVVLLSKIFDNSLHETFGFNDEWVNDSKVGSYLAAQGAQSNEFYILNAFLFEDVKIQYSIMEGFNNILELLVNNQPNVIKVIFVADDTIIKNDEYKFLFIFFLVHMAYALTSNPKLVFRILFRDDSVKRIFERTTAKIKDLPEDKNNLQSYSKQKLGEFARKALTNDPMYIAQLDSILKIIDEDMPILIKGESGVGKSFLAKIIHDFSIRNSARFEEQNCGGLVTDRLEQNLFGWIKGGFTGSNKDKKGKIANAEGGSLFLDEIDRAHISIRNTLITFIENKKYFVLGEEDERTADVRLIFGTNKNLIQLIKKKEFEEDFYYRIAKRIIDIPPLRERIDDIDLIVDYTLSRLAEKKGRIITIEKQALELFKNYSWPGNIRELTRYLEIMYYDCYADDINQITAAMVKEASFDGLTFTKADDLETLIELLKKFLDNWDISNGDIQHKLIAPIIAKIYIDNSYKNWNKTKKFDEAMKVVGMGGKGFTTSSLQKFYDEFPQIYQILGLDD